METKADQSGESHPTGKSVLSHLSSHVLDNPRLIRFSELGYRLALLMLLTLLLFKMPGKSDTVRIYGQVAVTNRGGSGFQPRSAARETLWVSVR